MRGSDELIAAYGNLDEFDTVARIGGASSLMVDAGYELQTESTVNEDD
jgi:hypothetical protein